MKGYLKFVLGVLLLIASVGGLYIVILGDFSLSSFEGTPRIIIGVLSFLILLGSIYLLRK